MHIGWDIDDVTTNLTEELLQIYNSRYHTNVRIGDVKDWNFFPEEVHEEMKNSGYRNLKLVDAAKEILSKLKEKGDKVSVNDLIEEGLRYILKEGHEGKDFIQK